MLYFIAGSWRCDPSLCRGEIDRFRASRFGRDGLRYWRRSTGWRSTGEVMNTFSKVGPPKLFLIEKLLPLAEGDIGQAE
jgi:hypothetical protein